MYDFLKILDDGKGLNRIYGRLWFVRDETRKKVHELYCVLFEIQKIQPCVMRLEMTAETSKSVKAEEIMNEFEINELEQTKKEALMIQMINDNLEDVFKKYNGSPADKINSGIDVLYDLIGKSWF